MPRNAKLSQTIQTAAPATAASSVIGVTAMKARMGVYHSLNDDTFLSVLESAVSFFENETGVSVVTQTWQDWYDCVWGCELKLAHNPVQAISEIRYYTDLSDTTGTVWPSTKYLVPVFHTPGAQGFSKSKIIPVAGWPTFRSVYGLRITYSAGFGTTADHIPAGLQSGLAEIAAYLYENPGTSSLLERGPDSRFSVRDLPKPTQRFLYQYKSIELS